MSPFAGKIIISGIVIVGSFFAGRFYQNIRNGYDLKEVSRKNHEFKLGQLSETEAFETIGFGFMTPQSTILEFEGRTLFKAAPFFQESVPVFSKFEIKDNELKWTDGEFDYQLVIEQKKPLNKTTPAIAQ